MIREEYLRRLTDAAYVDVYLSATDGGRLYWPWRMQPVHEADKRHRNACERYLVDSSFSREDITNTDVLETGLELDAEGIVLADVWHDVNATVEALVNGVELADDHAFDGQILLPLQPPHDECYQRLRDRGIGDEHLFAVGGVKDKPDSVKLQATRRLRDIAGDETHIHGLGFGLTDEIASAIRGSPSLVDSIDYSTPVQNAMDGTALAGDERMSVVAARAGAQLVEDIRSVTPYPDDATTERTVLTDF